MPFVKQSASTPAAYGTQKEINMSAKFAVLTGTALTSAIAGRAKAVATFTEREHQIAYSALNHSAIHNDPKYLNALYTATPVNYRKGLVSWSVAFGNVAFDKKTGVFTYVKNKKTDMDGAMDIAPANFEKQAKAGQAVEKPFDEVAYLESVVAKFADKGGDLRVLQALKGALTLSKTSVIAASKAEKVPAKAKTAKPAPATAPAQEAAAEVAVAA